MGEYVVIPAHSRGAAATRGRLSGTFSAYLQEERMTDSQPLHLAGSYNLHDVQSMAAPLLD